MRNLTRALVFSCGALSLSAAAQETEVSRWHWNSFGTLGLAHSSDDRADFVFDNLQPKGTGFNRRWNPDLDSRLGLQLNADLLPGLEAVVQVVSEQRPDNSYTPFLNWANLRYEILPDLRIRAGRVAMASFMASSSRKVGYSNPWIRPSAEVYRLLALTNSDGVDLEYRLRTGEFTHTLSALYGKKTVINTRDQHVHNTDVWGVYDTSESGPWTLHIAHQQKHTDNQNPPLGKFWSAGVSYDSGLWLLNAEWVRAENYDGRRVLSVREAWNLAAAYRMDTLTPFISLSQLRPLTPVSGTPVSQTTLAAGVRWDWRKNWDLKLQWDHVRPGNDSFGTLQAIQPGFPKGKPVNVLAVALDFAY